METRCPRCQAPPPASATCDACEETYAPFVTAGCCPRCALVWDRLECATCDARVRLDAWVADEAERVDFRARLFGHDPRRPDFWTGAADVLTTDFVELMTRAREAAVVDGAELEARAALLEAEDDLETARRGEREVAALAPQATSAALAPEVEAARRASRQAVDASLRVLDDARQAAEWVNRARLDREGPDLEPEPEVPPLVVNPPLAAACPGCGWKHDGRAHWGCSRCDQSFDAVTHHARCPGCGRGFVTTRCPACRARSPIARWWTDPSNVPPPPPSIVQPTGATPGRLSNLAARLASALDEGDPRQQTVAASLERAGSLADRALDTVAGWWATGKSALQAKTGDLGATRIKAEDWTGALEECNAALERDPRLPAALANRGCARRHLGDDDGALADFDAALRLDGLTPSGRAWTLCERARLRIGRADHGGSLSDLAEAFALAPSSRPLLLRAWVHWELGQLEQARADYDEALRGSDRSRRVLLARSSLHAERKAWREAEADADEAIRRRKRTSAAYLQRATARFFLGRFEEAEADSTRALRLDPQECGALLQRAWAREARGDVRALVDVARVRRRDPSGRRTRSRWSLALQAYFAGEPERATSLLRDSLGPDEPVYPALWLALLFDDATALPAAEGWPAWLVRFARGEVGADALLAEAASDADEQRRRERLCEAHGYVGLRAEREGRVEQALEQYRRCVEQGVFGFKEHAWARLRLAGVTPRAPKPRWTPPPAPAPKPPVRPTTSLIDQLERLGRLRDAGVLNDTEFALAKKRILDA